MSFARHSSLLSNGTVAEGAISISLNDSWTGRKLLEALDIPTSRFSPELMEMRYQQKQQIERDQRKSEMSTNNARSLAAIDMNDTKLLTASLGAGKVRQMFNERRQGTTGIDKSYPLQPITSNTRKSPYTKTSATSTITVRSSSNGGTTTESMKTTTSRVDGQRMFKNSTHTNNDSNNNKNHVIGSNNNLAQSGFLDNEEFADETLPETDDDIDSRSSLKSFRTTTNHTKTMPVKLPTVTKQLSNLSHNERDPPAPKPSRKTMGTINRPAVPAAARKLVPMKKATPPPATPPLKSPPSTYRSGSTAASRTSARTPSKASSVSPPVSAKTESSSNSMSRPSAPAMAARRPATATVPDNMDTCGSCGRNFNIDRLEKHEAICQKTAAKKRKVFDATSHRIKGTEAETFVKTQLKNHHIPIPKKGPVITASVVAKITANSSPPKKNDWRRKHEEFISAIRSAKQVQVHLARGGKLSDLPPPPPSENPDYVQCPHCQRRFNSTAAERHIPKCSTFQHNKPKPRPSNRKF